MTETIKQNEFKLKFDGRLNEVDANTLVKSLIGVNTLIEEINEQIGGGRLKISVKSLDKGSFLVHLILNPETTQTIKTILAHFDIDTISKIIASLVGILTLRKYLKGEKPDKVVERNNEYEIKTKQGNVVVMDKPTFNLYTNNPRVSDALGTTFETLNSDPSITGFELLDQKDGKLFDAQRDDFEGMATQSELIEENKRITTVTTVLYIFKLIFEDKYKWEFYYKGNKISAKIVDSEFFKKIDTGERFAKGDSLEVELQIEQVFDVTANTFINKAYQVNRVIKHLPRGTQEKLNFNSANEG